LKVITLALAATLAAAPQAVLAASKDLSAVRTDAVISIDGTAEAAWGAAPPLVVSLDELPYVPSTGYAGMKETSTEIRALYNDQFVYFLISYRDPTRSTSRWPWVKQPDGTWKQRMAKDSTDHENSWYEDKLSLYWNVSEVGFEKKGCDQSCHIADRGWLDGVRDSSTGRHYTATAAETVDMWHWKSARTNPVGQVDDQVVTAARKADNAEWGRNSDIKTGGGYADNINAAKTGPVWMGPPGEDADWILADAKIPFNDARFKPGDALGGIVVAPFTGPRGEITGRGVWKDGTWTLEIRRALVTSGERAKEHDVQFDDLSKSYPFSIAVFDNSQINHLYHRGALHLRFEPAIPRPIPSPTATTSTSSSAG
jgi:hypothetical protein